MYSTARTDLAHRPAGRAQRGWATPSGERGHAHLEAREYGWVLHIVGHPSPKHATRLKTSHALTAQRGLSLR
jgi:hypothetical protein